MNSFQDSWALNTLHRMIVDLNVYQDGREMSDDVVDALMVTIELVYRDLVAQEVMNGFNPHHQEGIRSVEVAFGMLARVQETRRLPETHQFHQQKCMTRTVGRPRFLIPYEQLSPC